MECEGAMQILWRCYTVQYEVYCTSVISDGDLHTHTAIYEEDVYSGIKVKKLECVGYSQHRMGTSLRKVKHEKNL